MTDPVTSYNRVPPPFDPESRDSHLDGELGKLEQSTASIIQKIGVLQRDYSTTTQMEAADDALADALTAAYTAADVVAVDASAAIANAALVAGLATKADLAHTHAQSDVTGLVAALAAKEPTITAGATGEYWRGDKTWQPLPVVESWTSVDLTTTPSKANSTTMTDITGLTFPVAANTHYRFRVNLFVYSGSSGISIGVNGPTGFTDLRAGSPATSFVSAYNVPIITINPGFLAAIHINGFIKNGSNAGNLTFRYAQPSSNGTAINVQAGSYLEYQVVA